MMQTETSLLPKYICQKRYQALFNEWGSIRGAKTDHARPGKDDKPGRFFANQINFEKKIRIIYAMHVNLHTQRLVFLSREV